MRATHGAPGRSSLPDTRHATHRSRAPSVAASRLTPASGRSTLARMNAVSPTPELRLCTCGAQAAARRETRRGADGQDEVVYRVACPVCGQTGPAVPLGDRGEAEVIAEAVAAWNALIARTRPLE